MQRMELYASGVKVPKLGTLQDRLARGYLTHKLNREVSFAKLLAYTASNTGDEKVSKEIGGIWREYINITYFLGEDNRIREEKMMREYEGMRNVHLTAKAIGKGEDRQIVISGIPKEFYK